MAFCVKYSNLIYLCLIVFIKYSASSEECVQKSPCLCQFDNDFVTDISNILPDNKFISAINGKFTYFYHGCTDFVFKTEVYNVTTNKCTEPLTLCLFNETDRSLMPIGTAVQTKFVNDKENPHLLEIAYASENLTTIIKLVCAPNLVHTELLLQAPTKNEHILELLSPLNCKLSTVHRLSTGSKLIIMFCVAFTIYLIGGALISYFIRGARGKEVIPNIDFWVSLPGLVRDGIIFVMNGCNPQIISTADTYDRI